MDWGICFAGRVAFLVAGATGTGASMGEASAAGAILQWSRIQWDYLKR